MPFYWLWEGACSRRLFLWPPVLWQRCTSVVGVLVVSLPALVQVPVLGTGRKRQRADCSLRRHESLNCMGFKTVCSLRSRAGPQQALQTWRRGRSSRGRGHAWAWQLCAWHLGWHVAWALSAVWGVCVASVVRVPACCGCSTDSMLTPAGWGALGSVFIGVAPWPGCSSACAPCLCVV